MSAALLASAFGLRARLLSFLPSGEAGCLNKEEVVEALSSWNFWGRSQETGVSRSGYLELLERLEKTRQVVVVTGVRRSGKSTLMKQLVKKMVDGGVDAKNFLYVNLEEPRFAGELSPKFLSDIFEAYLEVVNPPGKPVVFLDEVQKVTGWESFVRALHEKNEAMLFVSGSSADLLSQEFGSVLTGRHVDAVVYPLSFKEFLSFKNAGAAVETRLQALANKTAIKRFLREYLEWGGFPRVVLSEGSEEKREILARYFDDVLLRDVAERRGVRHVAALRTLAKHYLTSVGSPCSFRKTSVFLGVSLNTVERFSYYLREAFLVFFVKKFSFSFKEQEANPRKVYCVDDGLRNVLGFKFSDDSGKLYENTVFLELMKKFGEENVFYFKGKRECDFVVKKSGKVFAALQVCSFLNAGNKEREVEGLLEAMRELGLRVGIVVTDDFEGKEKHGGKTVEFVPLWKWLLEK